MGCNLNLSEIARASRSNQSSFSTSDLSVQGICTDSRKLKPGQLFVAIRGPNFDGHQFIEEAFKKGAVACMIEEASRPIQASGPLILVKDTLEGLQLLAQYWRRKLGFKVLAITGSNGKTTAKEFTHQLLATHLSVHSSQGSFNNHLGVPLSLLEVEEKVDYHIQEMGMNAQGEIAHLCQIAEPNVVACTMVGTAHIGELGSQEAVALAKEEIYLHSPQAQFIFNMDNEWTRAMHLRHGQDKHQLLPILFSSFNQDVDVFLRAESFDVSGMMVSGVIRGVPGKVNLSIFGRQNVVNLMVASSFGLSAGLSPEQIWQGLLSCKTSWGRNQWIKAKQGFSILFDAYNANPESMRSLITNLLETQTPTSRQFLVLGEMKELGSMSESAHQELGALAGQLQPEALWYIGQYADCFKAGVDSSGFKKNLMISDSYDDELAKQLSSMVGPDDIVAIKASRALQLERLVESWTK